MEEVNITKSMYKCQYCETLYDSKEKALECEEHYQLAKRFENLRNPYCWFILRYKDKPEEHYIFSYKVYISEYANLSCLNTEIQIYSSLWNDYCSIGNGWEVLRILSIEEAYDEFGIIPILGGVCASHIPNEIKYRIQNVYLNYNKTISDKIIEMSSSEMGEYIYNIKRIPDVNKDFFYNKDNDSIVEYLDIMELPKIHG